MVEGANSFFKSTAPETDDTIFFALSDNGICAKVFQNKWVLWVFKSNIATKISRNQETLVFFEDTVGLDINGSVDSFKRLLEIEWFSSETAPSVLPETKTFVWGVGELPSPSVTCEFARIILYAPVHRTTAPSYRKSIIIDGDMVLHTFPLTNRHNQAYLMRTTNEKQKRVIALQLTRAMSRRVHKSDKHQDFRMGFPSLCKELEWWSGKYFQDCLHPSNQVNWRFLTNFPRGKNKTKGGSSSIILNKIEEMKVE